jgi:putative transposase
LLAKVIKGKKKKTSLGQLRLGKAQCRRQSPWAEWEPLTTEVQEVAEKFVMANCYDPKKAMQLF